MKKLKKVLKAMLLSALCAVIAIGTVIGFTSCGQMGKIKIGVLIFDATDSEMNAFRNYLEKYIKNEYPNIDWKFINPGSSAETDIANMEDLIAQGCKGVIGFTDKVEVVSKANDSEVYYIKAAGQARPQMHDELKNFKYYVGSIGPSLEIEEERIGYEMMKYYIDSPENGGKGYTNLLIHGGLTYRGVAMHSNRYNGMKRALKEISDVEISADISGSAIITKNPKNLTINFIDGYPTYTEGFIEQAGILLKTPGLQVVTSVAAGVEAFGGIFLTENLADKIDMATVSAFTSTYKEYFDNGTVDYLVGKFASSIGPAVVALINSINGNGHRTANGEAFRLEQPYWIARTKAEFDEQYINDQPSSPAYTKDLLDKYIITNDNKVSYEEFANFVKASAYDEIQALKNAG